MQTYNQLDLFRDRLPPRLYCADNLESGLQFAYAQTAIKRRYIQPNRPAIKSWLPFDGDIPGIGRTQYWKDREIPAPNIVAENPANLHAHLFYGLEIPINTVDPTLKAAKYAAAVQYALMIKLGADPRYNGRTAKNPLSSFWNVRTYQQYLYTLDWLADYLDLGKVDTRRRSVDYGIGRNCTLFDTLRRYAYKEIRQHWQNKATGFQSFYDALETKAVLSNNNLFGSDNCLMYPEVKHIIKSVSTWTWQNFTPEDDRLWHIKQNLKSQQVRKAKAEARKQKVFNFINTQPGATNKQIAVHVGVSLSTVHRAKRAGKLSIPERVNDTPLVSLPDMVNGRSVPDMVDGTERENK